MSILNDESLKKRETERMLALYGENKKITDGNYDKSLAVKWGISFGA